MDDTVLVLPKFTVDEIAKHARFLILSLPNNEMSRKSPFIIHKALIGIGREPKSIKNYDQCQRFGHSQTSCRGQLTCSRCASVGHASTDCSSGPKCINCLQPHSSDSKICPKWKIEKKIQEIKTTKNISYLEARKLIVPQLSQTYAQAAKSSTLNNSTQTDENITKINCPPLKLLAPLSSKRRTNIFLLLLPHHPQPKRNSYPPSLQKHLQHRILSHQLPCLRQKGKLKNNHLHYIVPEKIAKNRLIKYKTYNKFKEKSCQKHNLKNCERARFPQ
ncbi:uncharacterized protein TNCV_4022551 [Trichonephila clavipes]|nr:uncharacterized protein TNCV_4022551 [Trichonephila clavipes]